MRTAVIFIVFFFLISCAKKEHLTSMDESDLGTRQERQIEEEDASKEQKEESDIYGSVDKEEIEESMLSDENVYDESSALKESEKGLTIPDSFEDIFFGYDSYEIKAESVSTLESLTLWMKDNKEKKIIIEGHCDDRGTNEYNLALGEKRALAIKDYMVFSGIFNERIEVISYGEEKPLCREKTETCYQKNRRGHIVLSN